MGTHRGISKVVVTGGSGRIGRHVLREMAPHVDVVNADLVPYPDVAYAETDVMQLEQVRSALKGADAVVHLAALDFDLQARPEEYMRVNTIGTWHVLQAAAELGLAKAVVCSSISATGLSEMRPEWTPQYLPVDEDHDCRPVHAYGVSKASIEAMALSFARAGSMDVLCIRPVAVLLQDAFEDYLELVGEPGRRWLYYYVTAEDVARGFRLAVEANGPHYGVFFLSADDSSLDEPTLEWYERRVGALPEIKNPRRYQLNERASVFANGRAREVLGWTPSSDFRELRRTNRKA